jgi:hypothetical protein
MEPGDQRDALANVIDFNRCKDLVEAYAWGKRVRVHGLDVEREFMFFLMKFGIDRELKAQFGAGYEGLPCAAITRHSGDIR